MAVHRQWALPFFVDNQDPQLLAVIGHVGGARGVHMLRGSPALCAAGKVNKKERNYSIHYLHKRRQCSFVQSPVYK